MPTTNYIPVNRSFYAELAVLATTGWRCQLVYRTEADSPPITYQGIITDLVTEDEVEYLRLTDGFTLRLDQLLAVNNKEARDYEVLGGL